ncbi:hypothetical protein AAHH78_43710, partial [Burkholderia pseudomallei]
VARFGVGRTGPGVEVVISDARGVVWATEGDLVIVRPFVSLWLVVRWPQLPSVSRAVFFHTSPCYQRIVGFWGGDEV